MSDPLFTVATGKAYFALRFEDIPPQFIVGGRCMVCPHRAPAALTRGRAFFSRGFDGILDVVRPSF